MPRTVRAAVGGYGNGDPLIRWLLDGDPAIRWQVLRDIVGAGERTAERERHKVARGGEPVCSRGRTPRARGPAGDRLGPVVVLVRDGQPFVQRLTRLREPAG